MVIFAATGVLSAYQLAANAAFVRGVPDGSRGQAFGLVMTGFSLGQSAALVAAGALAQALPVTSVIAISGAVGTVTAAGLAVRWPHAATEGSADASPPVTASRSQRAPSTEGS
jgi:predicted MFS family arabinose efflux permease